MYKITEQYKLICSCSLSLKLYHRQIPTDGLVLHNLLFKCPAEHTNCVTRSANITSYNRQRRNKLRSKSFLFHNLLAHLSRRSSRKQARVTNTPLHPTFVYSKTGVYRGIQFFLFLLQNIDCGYTLEPPHTEAVLTSTHNQCFEQKLEKIF